MSSEKLKACPIHESCSGCSAMSALNAAWNIRAPAQDSGELPKLRPYIYGRECGHDERVWAEAAVLEMQREAFEAGRQEGIAQERALWELTANGQALEATVSSAPAVPEGWKLVPAEETMDMLLAADEENDKARQEGHDRANFGNLWAAMLAAAPQPPTPRPQVELTDADRWQFAMDWNQKKFAVCMRDAGAPDGCWSPIKNDGPIDYAIAADRAKNGRA